MAASGATLAELLCQHNATMHLPTKLQGGPTLRVCCGGVTWAFKTMIKVRCAPAFKTIIKVQRAPALPSLQPSYHVMSDARYVSTAASIMSHALVAGVVV